jgi:hypothetical protein
LIPFRSLFPSDYVCVERCLYAVVALWQGTERKSGNCGVVVFHE